MIKYVLKMSGKETTTVPESKKPEFTFKPVKSKPERKYRKGSKYDPVIQGFLDSKHDLVQVDVPGKTANYMRTQLVKRIEAKKLSNKIKVSVVNDVCYLETIK